MTISKKTSAAPHPTHSPAKCARARRKFRRAEPGATPVPPHTHHWASAACSNKRCSIVGISWLRMNAGGVFIISSCIVLSP